MFDNIRKKVRQSDTLQELRQIHPDKKAGFLHRLLRHFTVRTRCIFNQCKTFGDVLIVGVGRDSTLQTLKGPGRPVNPEMNRVYLVAALQDVDYAVLNDTTIGKKVDFKEVLSELKPDVFVLNDDDSSIVGFKPFVF